MLSQCSLDADSGQMSWCSSFVEMQDAPNIVEPCNIAWVLNCEVCSACCFTGFMQVDVCLSYLKMEAFIAFS